MILSQKYPVLVIAHRGFSGVAPENTLAAFRKAIEAGSDMIELDVRLSRDGEVVVIHDETLKRTTNGRGKISDHTLAELKRLDAGAWFGSEYSGERIPALKEALEVAKNRILLNIELKTEGLGKDGAIDLADRSFQEIESAEMSDCVLFSSFDPAALGRIRMRKAGLPVALITGSPWKSPRDLAQGELFSVLNCRKTALNGKNLSIAHQKGITVHVWTVDSEKEMAHFISLGVDGIITNHPDRLIRLLKKARMQGVRNTP